MRIRWTGAAQGSQRASPHLPASGLPKKPNRRIVLWIGNRARTRKFLEVMNKIYVRRSASPKLRESRDKKNAERLGQECCRKAKQNLWQNAFHIDKCDEKARNALGANFF